MVIAGEEMKAPMEIVHYFYIKTLNIYNLHWNKSFFYFSTFQIMVHNPNSYPEVSHKYLVFWKNFTVSRISVLVNMVRTDETFARIAESARGCNMSSTDPYRCMLRCRQREIYRQCGCLPYYMYHFNRK